LVTFSTGGTYTFANQTSWQAIPSVTLTPGNYSVVSANWSGASGFQNDFNANNNGMNPSPLIFNPLGVALTLDGGRWAAQSDMTLPASWSTGGSPGFPLPLFAAGTFSAVPEASTIIAGALLLLPFGASTIRILRKKRTA
jgi:hypothetical protein